MREDIAYCTLFDSNYMERGIALIDSIISLRQQNTIYVVALDDSCEQYLSRKKYNSVVVISPRDFIDDELAMAKGDRDWKSFCWTCQASVPHYIFRKYDIGYLIYMDADIFFYRSPNYLIDELKATSSSVAISPHNFPPNITGHYLRKACGKYCSGFIIFKNDDIGKRVAREWRVSCLKKCTSEPTSKTFGDQKYLEDWEKSYINVYVIKEYDVGMAPWNISNYGIEQDKIIFKSNHTEVNPLFFHFHGTGLEEDNSVKLHLYTTQGEYDDYLIELLYRPYFEKIKNNRKQIREENVNIEKHIVLKNKVKGISKLKTYFNMGIIYLAVTFFYYKTRQNKDIMNI